MKFRGIPVWSMGWLFTIGFCDLSFWQGVGAFFIWPYYLGALAAGICL